MCDTPLACPGASAVTSLRGMSSARLDAPSQPRQAPLEDHRCGHTHRPDDVCAVRPSPCVRTAVPGCPYTQPEPPPRLLGHGAHGHGHGAATCRPPARGLRPPQGAGGWRHPSHVTHHTSRPAAAPPDLEHPRGGPRRRGLDPHRPDPHAHRRGRGGCPGRPGRHSRCDALLRSRGLRRHPGCRRRHAALVRPDERRARRPRHGADLQGGVDGRDASDRALADDALALGRVERAEVGVEQPQRQLRALRLPRPEHAVQAGLLDAGRGHLPVRRRRGRKAVHRGRDDEREVHRR